MPTPPTPPLLSREECTTLLPVSCINAMSLHKVRDRETYLAEIDTLAKIAHNLITYHQETLSSIVIQMEQIMTDAHNNEIEELNKKIDYLFNLRKQTPNSFYGEQETIKFTTEIRILEERKTIPIKDKIEDIIYESLDKAIKILGADPGNFNLAQYEYRLVIKKSNPNSNHHQENHDNKS